MAGESAAPLASLNAGELLYELKRQLVAGNVLKGGLPGGLIPSLDDSPRGPHPDGLVDYAPGLHRPQDLDVRQTLINRRPLARNRRDVQKPRKLHVVTELGGRYEGASGAHTLSELARFTVAVVSLTAEENALQLQTVTVKDGNKPEILDENMADAVWALGRFDTYSKKPAKSNVRGGESPLSSAITRALNGGESIIPDADACFVVSDFLGGAKRDGADRLTGFDWEAPLMQMRQQLGDRLFAVQLVSPAQSRLPMVRHLSHEGRPVVLDTGEMLQVSEQYARLAVEKAQRITSALSGIRHLALSSEDPRPLESLADFVFGKPPEA